MTDTASGASSSGDPGRISAPPAIPGRVPAVVGRIPPPSERHAVVTGRHSVVGGHSAVPEPPPRATSVPALAFAGLVGASIVVAMLLLAGAAWLWMRSTATADPVAAPSDQAVPPDQAPTLQPLAAGVTIQSSTPGLRLFHGPRELGEAPVTLTPEDLTGEPLVALAPLHQPQVIRAERLVELTRAIGRVHTIDLERTHRPDWMVYVRYDGQGTAHLVTGEALGQVPGVVRVPTRRDEPLPVAILVFDEAGQSVTLSLEGCESDKVCLLYAGSGS